MMEHFRSVISSLLSFSEFPIDVQHINAIDDCAEFLGSPVCSSEEFFNDSMSRYIKKVLECQRHLSDVENHLT